MRDEKDLYDKLDGRTVVLADRAVVLATRGKVVRHIGMSISQKIVSAFADPQKCVVHLYDFRHARFAVARALSSRRDLARRGPAAFHSCSPSFRFRSCRSIGAGRCSSCSALR